MFLKILLLCLTVLSMPAPATQWADSEVKAMPPYCAARLYRDPASVEYWKGILGPDYLHTHHFCFAIGFINRFYNSRTNKAKGSTLTDAMGNIDYVLKAFSPGNILLPEVYLNRGVVHSLMKKDAAAIVDWRKAIELNPKLARAYSLAADYYVTLKKQEEALKLATEGLRHNPENKALRRLYEKLGGRLPYPEPVTQQAKQPAAATPAERTPQPGNKEETGPPADAQITAPAPNNTGKDEGGQAAAETSPTPKIGSPSNPWCRFCPAEPNP